MSRSPILNHIFAFIVMAVILFIVIFITASPSKKTYSRSWHSMGTIAMITVDSKASIDDIQKITKDTFDEYEKLLSSWNPNSELSKVSNSAGHNIQVEISPLVTNVYANAFHIMRLSENVFNPFIKPLMDLWGFSQNETAKIITPPPHEKIKERLFSFKDVDFNGSKILLKRKGMRLDFGGIAKGAAIDEACNRLSKKYKKETIVINLGGNIRSLSNAPQKIAIRNPEKGKEATSILLPPGFSAATSGGYERYIIINGERFSHIIDGETGYPSKSTSSVTIISESAMLSDALSTTLFILGKEKGEAFIKKHFPEAKAIWLD